MTEAASASTRVRPATLSAAALALVGSPFRLHGLDPATGLDCVGLVFASLLAMGRQPVAPRGYGLRNLSVGQWLDFAERSGLQTAMGPVAADQVLLIALGYGQHHLMITSAPDAVVHAHAGLRRVVAHRLEPGGSILVKWRIAASRKV